MAGTQTERVIQVNNVLCVIGNATSGATIVGSVVAERNKTPLMSTDAGASLSARGLKYYFRIGAKTTVLAATAVDFARETAMATGVAPKKIAILADDTTFSQDAAKGVLARLERTNWPLFENVSFGPGTVSDFAILQRLKLGGVNLLLFQATFAPDGIQIQRAMKKLNYDLPSPASTCSVRRTRRNSRRHEEERKLPHGRGRLLHPRAHREEPPPEAIRGAVQERVRQGSRRPIVAGGPDRGESSTTPCTGRRTSPANR